MEYNSGVSMILPNSISLTENDFDDDDIVREQKNQNEIVELIMAAFEGHDEPSGDDSLNTTDSSHDSSDEQQVLNTNNNNNSDTNEQNELRHQQNFFPAPTISTCSPLIPRNDLHPFQVSNTEAEIPFNQKSHLVYYQNPNRPSSSDTPTTGFHYIPIDPMQAQYFYPTSTTDLNETQNQLNKLRILCSAKDRKASQLQNLCEEFREKYQNDTRALQYQLELSERSKYDWEQRYQLRNTQYEESIETNNQLHRTIKDSALKIQQLELIKTQFEKKFSDSESLIESLHRKVNELHQYESNARSQHDYELLLSTTREKHEHEIIELNEKLQNIQMNLQEKNIEVDELRAQLEFANKNTEKTIFERMETINHLNEQLLDSQRKYTDLLTTTSLESFHQTEIKQQLIHITNDKEKFETKCREFESEIRTLREELHKYEVKNARDSLDESVFDQSLFNENIRLKERLNEYIFKEKQLREINEELQHQIGLNPYPSKRSDSSSSSSSSSNETVITATVHMEQIRKLINQNEKLKKDLSDLQEKHDYEKQELYTVIEQLREDVNEIDQTKKLYIDVCQEKNSMEDTLRSKFENELKLKLDDLRQQNNQEMERLKTKHGKQINELNNELDGLRANDDVKNRLIYTEKEFEQLKQDYHNINIKQSNLLKTCAKLENENENLLNSLEQIKREKLLLTQKFDNDIKQLNIHQKQELLSLHQQTDQNKTNLEEDIESLKTRIINNENTITQYEEYRVKLENNLQKLTQQRDAARLELRLTKEMLINKENESNQTRVSLLQETEIEYHEKLRSLEAEKSRLEECLQQANHALDLADSHLQQEIEKIKISLEQEYNRRYERDHKQSSLNLSNSSQQDIEDIKKMYRTEIDRLYRENIELSQHQSKLIDAHQKQMENMKKDLDDGYKNVINEFQREQVRSQTRYDQLKQQLNDALQTIEELKLNLNQIKINHSEDILKVEQEYNNENRTRQNRIENLTKLLEQSNDALNQERTLRLRQESDYQQTINSLQKKISDIIKQHAKTIDELKRELQEERSNNQNHLPSRPISVPDFTSTDLSSKNMRSDYLTTVEKLRELFTNEMIALLRLTCKMIFDVHHRVTIAQCMDNLDISVKKQIQNELIRSRNSMIKEMRREIFEKITHALKSQALPDKIIDMHIFELDRLLSQLVQDCRLDSLSTISPSSSNSSISSHHITPQPPSGVSPRKSVESIYITSSTNKKPAPLAPHSLDHNQRPKSASNIFLANQNSNASTYAHKFQRSNYKNFRIKMHRSEDDIVHAMQSNKKQIIDLDADNTTTLCGDDIKSKPSKVQLLTKQFELQAHSLPGRIQMKHQTPNTHYTTTQIINRKKQDDDDDELSWPQEPIPIKPPTHSNGIKKFVRNSLRLFITQPQQHKRTGK